MSVFTRTTTRLVSIALVCVVSVFMTPLSRADSDADLILFKAHLEFLGYSCENRKGVRLSCKTSLSDPNFTLKKQSGGWLMVAYYRAKEEAKRDRAGFLNMINEMNKVAIFSRYYADKDGDFALEGWFPGDYNKKNFALILNMYNKDYSRGRSNNRDAIIRYLK